MGKSVHGPLLVMLDVEGQRRGARYDVRY